MNKRVLWSRILCIIGLAVMAASAVTLFGFPPVQILGRFWGFLIGAGINRFLRFLLGAGIVAAGAILGKSRYCRFLYGTLALIACGWTELILMVTVPPQNFNFEEEFRQWWAYFVLACPIGGIMSLVGAVLVIIESFHRPPVPKDNAKGT